jgi:hypothetical protein
MHVLAVCGGDPTAQPSAMKSLETFGIILRAGI